MKITTEKFRLRNEKEAAEYLSVAVRTLQAWRLRGGGPKYVSISRRCVKYRLADLDMWVADKLATSTSDMSRG
ncbi:MAG: helix-turn-helix domain-containing protein [Nitrospinae bacterium]|nr:helix-turn-helix domain-containing protein [Nitrospinota bacterium]